MRLAALSLVLLLACDGDGTDTSIDTGSLVDTDTDSPVDTDTDSPVDTERLTCDTLEAEYAALVVAPSCVEAEDCLVLNGQCGVGLGGCYALSNGDLTQSVLDDLGAAYAADGCTGGVCDCAEAMPVDCVAGVCVFTAPPDVERCVWTATSNVPGVSISGPDVPCTATLAEADVGLDITWHLEITEEHELDVDEVSCASVDASGLRFLEVVSTDGTGAAPELWCPRCDLGRCSADPDNHTTVVGVWDSTFTWRPRQWSGPSDFGQQPGDLFDAGDYELVVVASGVFAGSGVPWEVRLQTTVTLLP